MKNNKMKIVFMGSPDFSIPSLKQLAGSDKIEIKGVVTQPDRKQGRGQKYHSTPVKKEALKFKLPVWEESNINNKVFITKLKELKLDAIVVVAFGQKLSKKILDLPKYGCINLHASLLPKYRGASPIHYAVVNGDNKTGVTIMYMEEELDTGDIIAQKNVNIDEDETVGDVHDKLAVIGADLLLDVLLKIKNGTANRTKQNEDKATFAHKLKRDFGEIDWEKSAQDIYNLVRGVNPWPGAYTYLDDKLLKIWQVKVVDQNNQDNQAGQVINVNKNDIQVQCGNGIISLEKIQLAGRKKMSTPEFLRGYELKPGLILG